MIIDMLALSGPELGKDCCQIGSALELHFILQAPHICRQPLLFDRVGEREQLIDRFKSYFNWPKVPTLKGHLKSRDKYLLQLMARKVSPLVQPAQLG